MTRLIESYYSREWAKICNAYKELYLRYLAARRDYPYFEHPKPMDFFFTTSELQQMQDECEREFNRTI